VDTETIKELQEKKIKWAKISPDDEEEEHSLEMTIPWIALLAPNAKIVPIMVSMISFEDTQNYASVLAPFFAEKDTSVVVSSDFSHWGAR
jgi:AmmeMemoRadiSam system protein B